MKKNPPKILSRAHRRQRLSERQTVSCRRFRYRHKEYKAVAATIRNLVAPTLVEHYEIVCIMKRGVVAKPILAFLYDLSPGNFKAQYEPRSPRGGIRSLAVGGTLKRILLKHERDLFPLQLGFGESIWRVMRVVGERPAQPHAIGTAASGGYQMQAWPQAGSTEQPSVQQTSP